MWKNGTIRIFLAVDVAQSWELQHMDVCNSFLHGDLEEKVYMELPQRHSSPIQGKGVQITQVFVRFKAGSPPMVVKLSDVLKTFGFSQSYAYYSLFTYQGSSVSLHVLVYVDDLIIDGSSHDVVLRFKQYLSSFFFI